MHRLPLIAHSMNNSNISSFGSNPAITRVNFMNFRIEVARLTIAVLRETGKCYCFHFVSKKSGGDGTKGLQSHFPATATDLTWSPSKTKSVTCVRQPIRHTNRIRATGEVIDKLKCFLSKDANLKLLTYNFKLAILTMISGSSWIP